MGTNVDVETRMAPERLREIVEAAGGRRRLADAVGVPEGSLQNFIRGRPVPPEVAVRLEALTPEQLALTRDDGRGREVLPGVLRGGMNGLASDAPLAVLAREWLTTARDSRGLSKRTFEGYSHCIGLVVKAGIRTLDELTRERIGAFLETRRGLGMNPATLNRNLAAICSFASALERRGLIELDRLFALRRLRYRVPPTKPPFFLTPEQAARVEEAAFKVDRQLGVAVVLGLASGLRAGELVGVRHEELKLEKTRPFLVVRRDAERENKTYRERTVPIRERDAKRLLELGLGGGRSGPVFPNEKRNSKSPYLAANSLGRRLAIVRYLVGDLGGKLDFITLRHSFASTHVQAGVSLLKVSRWLGHSSVKTTEKHYVSLLPGGDPDVERSSAFFDGGER